MEEDAVEMQELIKKNVRVKLKFPGRNDNVESEVDIEVPADSKAHDALSKAQTAEGECKLTPKQYKELSKYVLSTAKVMKSSAEGDSASDSPPGEGSWLEVGLPVPHSTWWSRKSDGEKILFIWLIFILFAGLVALIAVCVLHEDNEDTLNATVGEGAMNYDVVILGGDLTGLYLASELLTKTQNSVLLIEDGPRLGGRIYDMSFSKAPEVVVGLGDDSFKVTDKLMGVLANTLKIVSEKSLPSKRVFTRGVVSELTPGPMDKLIAKAFPSIHNKNLTFNEMFAEVFKSSNLDRADGYLTVESYISEKYGSEGSELLLSPSIFPGFLTAPGTREALEILNKAYDTSTPVKRPRGGMSSFIKALAHSVRSSNGSILLNEKTKMIQKTGNKWNITTDKQTVQAKRLILSITPYQINKLQGDVMEKIKSHRIFQALTGVDVVKCAALYATPWWSGILGKHETLACPQQGLGNVFSYGGNVLQTVYSGHPVWWKMRELGEEGLEKSIEQALRQLNDLGGTPQIPVQSQCKFWDNAEWSSIRTASGVTRAELMKWAASPLLGHALHIAGTSFGPGTGQLEDGLVSAENVLQLATD